jgi:hypothetical protein
MLWVLTNLMGNFLGDVFKPKLKRAEVPIF